MNTPFLLALLLLVIIIVWVIAKVRHYARVSERQWERVDKSRLRRWEDDD